MIGGRTAGLWRATGHAGGIVHRRPLRRSSALVCKPPYSIAPWNGSAPGSTPLSSLSGNPVVDVALRCVPHDLTEGAAGLPNPAAVADHLLATATDRILHEVAGRL